MIKEQRRELFVNVYEDPSEPLNNLVDENFFSVNDDLIVSRTAIVNADLTLDSIALSDFLIAESGSLLPPADICIEHGIEVI